MKELIRSAIKTTNDNIILTIPLIIFMWIVGAYLGYSKFTADTLPELSIAMVTILFMLGAFLSGWFYMVKQAVQLSKKVFVMDEDKSKATLHLFKEIPTGIGNYFLSFIGMTILFIVLFTIMAYIVYQIGNPLIGDFDFSTEQIKLITGTPDDVRKFIDTLTASQILKFAYWNLLFMFGSTVISFSTLLWIPEITNGLKNPIVALFTSIKKIYTKPLKAFGLFLFIAVTNFVLSFISTFAQNNPITYLLMMVVYFYFLAFIAVLLFTYYDDEFLTEDEEEKDKEELELLPDSEKEE